MEKEILVKRYTPDMREAWNSFCASAKNPLFMFDRGYMEYHQDRFVDHSLLFYAEDTLVALLPASEAGGVLNSHGGLTYGGLIVDTSFKQHTCNACFEALLEYAKEQGFHQVIYKEVPHIYHVQPAEEAKYALFLNGANLKKVEPSTVLDLRNPIKMPKGRKAQISRAKREGVIVKELDQWADYEAFISLENEVLRAHHET